MGTSCDVLQSLQLAQKVSTVELFVSHSSKCPSGKKLLALCHYLNLDLAIFSSFLACILGVILVLRAGSFFVLWHLGASASGSVWQCLLVADSGVRDDFCRHLLSNKLLWFDKLCIDQDNLHRRPVRH